MTTPYTYLIGWKNLNLWYYGVRYANGCDPQDLWNPYKTSSKYVKECFEKYGTPTVIEVRKTFTDEKLARIWEQKVLRRLKVVNNTKWINKTDNKAIASLSGKNHPHFGKRKEESPSYGVKRPYVAERNRQEWLNNNPMHNDECKRKSIINRSGDYHHMKKPEIKEKVSGENNWIYKKPGALEERRARFILMNKSRIGMKYEKIPCPICNNEMPKNNFKRHLKLCENKGID